MVKPYKIVMAHNFYRSSSPCGENRSFEAEAKVLEDQGHPLIRYTRESDEILKFSKLRKALVFPESVWSQRTYREMSACLKAQHPAVVHFQNIHPLISPSAYAACRKYDVPVVQALRNFRILCPMSMLLRDHKVCELCVSKQFKWPSIQHKCYQDSALASTAMAGMLWSHSLLGTWKKQVDVFVCPSQVVVDKFAQAGWDTDSFRVKPNVLGSDPGTAPLLKSHGLFIGRLSEEKGLKTLLEALVINPTPFKFIGYGEGEDHLVDWIRMHPEQDVEYVGAKDEPGVLAEIKKASYVVFPSIWYETFGRVILEAFACSRPVIASDLGAMKESVQHEKNGLLFPAGDAKALASEMKRIWEVDGLLDSLSVQARRDFETKFSPQQNYKFLTEIYAEATEYSQGRKK